MNNAAAMIATASDDETTGKMSALLTAATITEGKTREGLQRCLSQADQRRVRASAH